MYLSNIKIWNFRKYGKKDDNPISEINCGLNLDLKNGLNLLVGENDSGKTAIVDAIKHLLYTQSREYLSIEENDFHWHDSKPTRETELRVECRFSGFTDEEASGFLEWIQIENSKYELRVWLTAEYKNNRVITNIKAGIDNDGGQLDGEARDLLRVTYLKPLRDARAELTPSYKSRLAQILKNHPNFQDKKNVAGERIEHVFEKIVKEANSNIKKYFEEGTYNITIGNVEEDIVGAIDIKEDIQKYLEAFFPINETPSTFFEISGSELIKILQKLGLSFGESKSGLGSLNLLFIATELLLWKHTMNRGLKLLLVEEIEAHLHPQAQLRLIEYLNKENGQFILTTHSTTLASKIDLENLVVCTKGGNVFPMSSKHTKLLKSNYGFLQRFLDATKANLFFAKGVILVEGDAENLLMPTIAEILGKPLHKYGVSIVNVGSTAFLHYARIFLRKGEPHFETPVAVITDLDQPPFEFYEEQTDSEKKVYQFRDTVFEDFKNDYNTIDYSGLENMFFTNLDDLKDHVRSFNTNRRLLSGQTDWVKNKKEDLKRDIERQDIQVLRDRKKQALNRNTEEKVKWFYNENWTLEYDLALSQLRDILHFSVLAGKSFKKNNSISLSEKIAIKNQVTTDFRAWVTNEKTAYNIYKPLLTKEYSKAITAQILALSLKIQVQKGEDVKRKIENSPTLQYLVDAINHVTGN